MGMRDIELWTYPSADGTWGVAFKGSGQIESRGHSTEAEAEEHIRSKPAGEFARYVLWLQKVL